MGDLSLTKVFKKAVKWGFMALVFGLAVEMIWTFPIVHNTIIGQHVTAWSTDYIRPVLDGFAEMIGLEAPSTAITNDLGVLEGSDQVEQALSNGAEGGASEVPEDVAPATEGAEINEKQYQYDEDLPMDEDLFGMNHDPVGKIGPSSFGQEGLRMAA